MAPTVFIGASYSSQWDQVFSIMVEELPQFNPRIRGMKVRYPPQIAKRILKQALEALSFLHKNGIAHGDLQPGNMLFALKNVDSTPMDVIRQKEDGRSGSISPRVQRLDGKQDLGPPRYLCIAQPLVAFADYSEELKIKLSDMGGGKFLLCLFIGLFLNCGLGADENVFRQPISSRIHRRSPLHHSVFGRSINLWMFGVLVILCLSSSQGSHSSAYRGPTKRTMIISWHSMRDSVTSLKVSLSIGRTQLYISWRTVSSIITI